VSARRSLAVFGFAALCAVAGSCKKREPLPEKPLEPARSSAPSASNPFEEPPTPPLDLGPASSALGPLAREDGVLALLTGQVEAKRLKEISTEPGETIDPAMRDSLAPRRKPPRVQLLPVTAEGMPSDTVKRITNQNLARLQSCYERGLSNNPYLQGRVTARLTIGEDGRVTDAEREGSDLPDSASIECMLAVFRSLIFPKPDANKASAVVKIGFEPPDAK
jgi:hypothetical protein